MGSNNRLAVEDPLLTDCAVLMLNERRIKAGFKHGCFHASPAPRS